MKLFVFLAVAIALTALSASAGEPGNLMHITTRMHTQMPGTHGVPPMTHTQTVCTSATKPDPRQMMRQNKMCKIINYQRAGNTVSYQVTCGGEMQMSGDAKFTLLAGGGIHGTTHMTGNAGGQKMAVDMTVDGTRTGSCVYTPPATR